jgi:transcription elongation factor Elf1
MKDVTCPVCHKENKVAGLGPVFTGLWKKPKDDEIPIYCGFCGARLIHNASTDTVTVDYNADQ